MRRKPPATRNLGITHTAKFGGTHFHLTVNVFPDGVPGEVFCKARGVNKDGVQGWCDAICEFVSLALQSTDYTLEQVCRHLRGGDFPPNGFTAEPGIQRARSFPDYLGKWLWLRFGNETTGGDE